MSDIEQNGMMQGDLVQLLANGTGRLFVPYFSFSDQGNGALGLVGSSVFGGYALNATTDEAVETVVLFPKDVDVTKAISIYVYWSSADTAGNDAIFDVDYLPIAAGDDIGAAVSNSTVTDTDSTTADALNVSGAISIAADTLAANTELLFLSLRRDAGTGDDLDADAIFHGIRIDYTSTPKVTGA